MKPFFLLTFCFILISPIGAKTIVFTDYEGSPISGVKYHSSYQNYASLQSDSSDINGILLIKGFKGSSIYFLHPKYNPLYTSYNELKDGDTVRMVRHYIGPKIRIRKRHGGLGSTKFLNSSGLKEIAQQNGATTADLLSNSGQVFVQKSQLGGGSPMIRGFSANRVLIVVDGVRMNNAIYRSGNLQNIISLDPNYLSNASVVYGPGSLSYGSDALGGTMDFETKGDKFTDSDTLKVFATVLTRFASASNERTGHLDVSLRNNKISSLTSFSYSDFGDLKMGKKGADRYLRNKYQTRENNQDLEQLNNDPYTQIGSGFRSTHFLQKVNYKTSEQLTLSYGLYYSITSNIPRYDRLIQERNNVLRYAKWEYGPQQWMMHRIGLDYYAKNTLFDELDITLAIQDYQESRINRAFGSQKETQRKEKVGISTLNADLSKKLKKNLRLYYGAELNSNLIGSTATEKNILNGAISNTSTRYPDNSSWASEAFYFILEKKEKQSLLQFGLRGNFVHIDAQLDTSYYAFPISTIDQNLFNVNGSMGWTRKLSKETQFGINVSTGFRAPNMDDLAKVFDSEPGNLILPNSNLKPEIAYSLDINYYSKTENGSVIASLFATYLDQAMVRQNAQFNGQDSIVYEGVLSQVSQLTNEDHALVYGLQISYDYNIWSKLFVAANLNMMAGETKNGYALRHVSPTFGTLAVQWKTKKLFLELSETYNGKISYNNLALSERNKTHIYDIDNNGNPYSPDWIIFSSRMSYNWNESLTINAAIENILDKAYRPYSSGIAAAGRNFIFSLSYRLP